MASLGKRLPQKGHEPPSTYSHLLNILPWLGLQLGVGNAGLPSDHPLADTGRPAVIKLLQAVRGPQQTRHIQTQNVHVLSRGYQLPPNMFVGAFLLEYPLPRSLLSARWFIRSSEMPVVSDACPF